MTTIERATEHRGPFQGVGQIVRYNWPFYASTGTGILLAWALVAFVPLPQGILIIVGAATVLGAWWAVASLVASYWVYDHSRLTEWKWLARRLPAAPRRWVNIHAGLDESSLDLSRLFPAAPGVVLDMYDPSEMSEPSIERARRSAAKGRGPDRLVAPLRCDFRALPLSDGDCDAVFLLFAAHEVRNRASREAFFRELHRSLISGGVVVLVEHLRDVPNFLAFGPGFFHFLPRSEWLRLGELTDMELEMEARFTPFVRLFVWRKE